MTRFVIDIRRICSQPALARATIWNSEIIVAPMQMLEEGITNQNDYAVPGFMGNALDLSMQAWGDGDDGGNGTPCSTDSNSGASSAQAFVLAEVEEATP